MQSAHERYKEDPVFRALTDQFRSLLYSDGGQNLTPSDVRAAALLAATMHEYENVRPIMVYDPADRYIAPELWKKE